LLDDARSGVIDHHLPDVVATRIEVVDLPLTRQPGACPSSGLEATDRSVGREGPRGDRRRLSGGDREARDSGARGQRPGERRRLAAEWRLIGGVEGARVTSIGRRWYPEQADGDQREEERPHERAVSPI